MLPGYEQETGDLSDYELKKLLPVIVRSLRKKIGKASAITNAAICEGLERKGHTIKDMAGNPWFNPNEPIAINEARVRKIINYIRNHGIINALVASSNGYYVATNLKEMKEYVATLKSREDAIRTVREGFEAEIRRIENRIEQNKLNDGRNINQSPNQAA